MCMCGGITFAFYIILMVMENESAVKNVKDLVMEVYGCSPSYSGARDRRMVSLGL